MKCSSKNCMRKLRHYERWGLKENRSPKSHYSFTFVSESCSICTCQMTSFSNNQCYLKARKDGADAVAPGTTLSVARLWTVSSLRTIFFLFQLLGYISSTYHNFWNTVGAHHVFVEWIKSPLSLVWWRSFVCTFPDFCDMIHFSWHLSLPTEVELLLFYSFFL